MKKYNEDGLNCRSCMWRYACEPSCDAWQVDFGEVSKVCKFGSLYANKEQVEGLLTYWNYFRGRREMSKKDNRVIEKQTEYGKQPMPTGDGIPITEKVIEDLKKRTEVGVKKYGTPLKTDNGRDALQDAYEEALDLCQYLKQAIMERNALESKPGVLEGGYHACFLEAGCHDKNDGKYYSDCVFDYNRSWDCCEAGDIQRKEQCEYWRDIRSEGYQK